MNALTTTNVNLPAHLSGRIGAPSSVTSDMLSGMNSSGFKRISIRGGRFRVREGSNETVLPDNTLRCVIVGASPNHTKSFYKGAYNPKATEEKKPDCYSMDGIRPASDAEDPQGTLCATCPQNAWGSKTTENGQQMKACADQKRLAIISANDTSDEPELYLFQVTPSALNGFKQYAQLLASKGLPSEIVVTEISFDPNESYPKAQFRFAGYIDEAMVPVVDGLVGSPQVHEITGQSTPVAKVVEPPKVNVSVHHAPAPKPAAPPPPPQIEDAVFEDVPPPPKATKGFGAPPTPKEPPPAPAATASNLAGDIQDILNSMQDEDNG